jgi:hypothetical protein
MDQRISEAIREQKSALCLFFDNEKAFYETYCNELTNGIIREKRILEFETPNRVKVTYEYDIEINKEDWGRKDILFLFLPDKRKSWLKIFLDGKRLTIPESAKIRETLFSFVKKDVEKLKDVLETEKSADELWKEIWEDRKPLPCFVYTESFPKDPHTGIMEIVFYDFLDLEKSKKKSFFRLFDEKHYQYTYTLVARGNSWLYVKSPSRFDVDVYYNREHIESNEKIDPEISSYTIKGRNRGEQEEFSISIKVPPTLRLWYTSLVYLGVIYIISLIGAAGYVVCQDSCDFTPVFAQLGISIIAAVIATRGWLMNEETVLKRVSMWLTWIVILIVFLLIGVYSFFMLM